MPALLQVSDLTKRFPGVLALEDVSLRVDQGEFVAVIGENGAGKSTLMKLLAGIHQPDAGTIEFEGHAVVLDSVLKAQALGISLIHQELNLADNLDVRTKEIAGGIKQFTGPGLRQYEALAAEGRRTLEEINRAVKSLEKNPQQLIFGAKPQVPEHVGR
jgi:ribose transport system ATP-binding protein